MGETLMQRRRVSEEVFVFEPSDRALQSENLLPIRGVTASEFPPLRNIPDC